MSRHRGLRAGVVARILRRARPGARTFAGTLAAVTTLALVGCVVGPVSPGSDSDARDRFITLLDEAQRMIGGDWMVEDDPTPRECVVPLWVAGERYPALRIGDAPAAPAAAAERVVQAWSAAGMTVTRTDVGDVIEVRGETSDGELLILRVSASASTLLGESECRPL